MLLDGRDVGVDIAGLVAGLNEGIGREALPVS